MRKNRCRKPPPALIVFHQRAPVSGFGSGRGLLRLGAVMNPDGTPYELREFVCKNCGHKVVINPALPADYVPNICRECWQRGESQRRAQQSALVGRIGDFLRKIGESSP